MLISNPYLNFKQGVKLCLICLFLTFLTSTAWTQNNASITGRVLNKNNNNSIPFANVFVEGSTTGALTDSAGYFTLNNLPQGFVKLQVVAIGVQPTTTQEIMLNSSKPYYIDIKVDEDVETLEAAVVRRNVYQRSAESPVSLRQLGQADIEKSAGSGRDISKVIQTLPGVSFTAANRNDVIVRGGGSSENRYYLDGVELPYINHFTTQGSSGGVVGIINPDFIRGLDFYSGAFPAGKGNALSSVIEFRQIDGNPKEFNYRATVGASDLAFTVNGPISKKTSVIASVRRSYLQFLFSVLKLPFLPTYNDFQFKVKTQFDSKNELTFIGIGALDNNRLNSDMKDPDEKQTYLLNWLPESKQWTYTFGAVYKHYNANGYDMLVASRNALDNEEYKYPYNDESKPKLLNYNSTEVENKIRYEKYMKLGVGTKLSFGANYEYATYTNTTYRRNGAVIEDYANDLNLNKWGGFVQASQELFDRKLQLSFGLRTDASSYSSHTNNLSKQLSPRLSASFVISPQFILNANAGRYHQLPSYTALGYRDQGAFGNKDHLRYIQSDHLVAGFEVLPTASSKITVEGFYKHYTKYPFSVRDSVVLAAKGGADYGVFGDEELRGIGEGRSYGIEVLGRTSNWAGFNVMLSYTLFWSEYKGYQGIGSNFEETGSYIPSLWDNRHLISIMGSRSLGRNWTMGAKWRLGASTPYTPYDLARSADKTNWDSQNKPVIDYNQFNKERLGAFHQLDMRVDKAYYFKNWSLSFYIDIQNIYGFKNKEQDILIANLGTDGKPITDANDPTKYEMKPLNFSSGTVLPTIGVMIQF